MKINHDLFDLTLEQEATSKMFYNGKIIKCLVAPYHNYASLEKIVPFTDSTYLFPERELSAAQLTGFISMVVVNQKHSEFRIITTNQNIIMDMVDGCVRVLTENNEIIPCPIKTMMANIHDIRYSLLQNEAHQKSSDEKSLSRDHIQGILDRMNAKSKVTRSEYDAFEKEIDMIGEQIISTALRNQLEDLKII